VPRFIALRGEEHRLVADNYQNLATAIARQGRLDEALPLHRKAYEVYKASNWEHFRTDIPLLSIAYIELQLEHAAAAEAAAMTALNTFRDALPGTYLEGVALCLAGLSKERQGDLITGTPMVEASHPLILQVDLTESPYPALCRVPAVNAQ
jgi:tetratricopeptide (TPR) repeat protein